MNIENLFIVRYLIEFRLLEGTKIKKRIKHVGRPYA